MRRMATKGPPPTYSIRYTVLSRVSAAYNHALHLKGRTKMMQDWADFLEQTQRGAKVLSFPDRTA